jgi:hypothetical protein
LDLGGDILKTTNNQVQFRVEGRLIRQLLALLLEAGQALAHAEQPGLKLGLVDEPLGITIDSPGDPLPELGHLRFDRGQRRLVEPRLWPQAAPIFLCQPLRVGQ